MENDYLTMGFRVFVLNHSKMEHKAALRFLSSQIGEDGGEKALSYDFSWPYELAKEVMYTQILQWSTVSVQWNYQV